VEGSRIQIFTRSPHRGDLSIADTLERVKMSRGAPAEGSHAGLILALVGAAQFMVVLDISVVNVALPAIREDLDFSLGGLQWVVNAYTITFGGLLLLGGRASDLLGRRRMFITGILVFALASLAGALAPNASLLVVARAAQGIGGAIVAPSTLAVLMTTFPEGPERQRALAVWGAMTAGGGSAGAILGGVLTDVLDWRWIFLVNVPVGAVIAWEARRSLAPDPERTRQGSFDLLGALTVTGGLVVAVFAIVRTTTEGWGSPQTLASLALAALLLGAFLASEAKVARQPLVPLRIFESRLLAGANVLVLLMSAAMFAMWYFVSLYLQQVLGYSPIRAGLAFLPMTFTIAAGSLRAAVIVRRFGIRATLLTAFALASVGLALFSRIHAGGGYATDVLPASLLVSLGMGLSMVPLTTTAVAGVAHREAGLASGLLNVFRLFGGALGLALLVAIAEAHTSGLLAHHSTTVAAATADGFGRSFIVASGIALLGAAMVLPLVGRVAPVEPEVAADLGG
jgi:EmrB/QacA subfamily drug resistance transporter